jgi:hypothetical protein
MGRVGRGGYRVSIWACSHVLRHRQVCLNAPNPGVGEAPQRGGGAAGYHAIANAPTQTLCRRPMEKGIQP